mmetsp:Transcript_19239/g.28539  ORF Transcript_19239/g.28539 Transcript_19239/m.28539 type:complete len:106 (+) Transcript_19239:226-543(+)
MARLNPQRNITIEPKVEERSMMLLRNSICADKHPVDRARNMAMKHAFRLYIGVSDWSLLDWKDDCDCIRAESEDGYVFAANVDTDARHPSANTLPTRAADAVDIS